MAILVSTPGCEVNKGDNDGWTPLWLAAFNGYPETVQALLAAPGIDLNKAPTGVDKRHIGKSPLTIAREEAAGGRKSWETEEQAAERRKRCQEVVRLLEGAGAR
jgi:ankyrin repeat protein